MIIDQTKPYDLVCFIVDVNVGSRVVHLAKDYGASGGTIFFGVGTIHNSVLEIFGLDNIRREIVLMAVPQESVESLLANLGKKLHLEKPNHGISFRTPIVNIWGSQGCYSLTGKENDVMHQAIITIVNQGQADNVIAAAVEAGAKGGTIINGRGAGSKEMTILFGIEVEPEIEIVLILASTSESLGICRSIKQQLQIEEPGNGILFTVNLSQTIGLY